MTISSILYVAKSQLRSQWAQLGGRGLDSDRQAVPVLNGFVEFFCRMNRVPAMNRLPVIGIWRTSPPPSGSLGINSLLPSNALAANAPLKLGT